MRGSPLRYIAFLLLHAALVRTAPAKPGGVTDTDTSLTQLNHLTADSPITTSRLSSSVCPQGSANNVEVHRFAVPGTTTILKVLYCPGLPIDKALIGATVSKAREYINHQLKLYGNVPLHPADDPYIARVLADKDCTMKVESQRLPGSEFIPDPLTYQVVLNALRGLFGFLYTDGHAGHAVTEVIDPGLTGGMMTIGTITISTIQ